MTFNSHTASRSPAMITFARPCRAMRMVCGTIVAMIVAFGGGKSVTAQSDAAKAADPFATGESQHGGAYQNALALIEQAAADRDAKSRDQKLDQAQTKLKEYIDSNPDQDLALAARERLASLLRFRAASLWSTAGQPGVDRDALRTKVQAIFQNSIAAFEDLAKRLRGQLDALPKGEQPDLREKIGTGWLDARLNVLAATFDLALTADNDKDQRAKLLTDTAKQAGELYQRFPKRKGGWFAHLYEGKANQELGDRTKALAAYQDLLVDLADADGEFRPLKTQAMRQALGLWLEDKNYSAAVDKALPWAKSAKGNELQDADWLAVKLSTATALKELAGTLPKKDPKVNGYLKDARELANDVRNSPNIGLQQPARELLAQLAFGAEPASAAPAAAKSLPPPDGKRQTLQFTADTKTDAAAPKNESVSLDDLKTFDAAFDRASEAADDLTAVQSEIGYAQDDDKPDAKHIAELKADLIRKQKELLPLCQRAIALATPHTNLEKLNKIRYLLCYFHYTQKNYYDAAVVGESLARQFPDAADSPSAAHISLAALDVLQRDKKNPEDDSAFASAKLTALAEYMVNRWPDNPESGVAMEALLKAALVTGDYEKAQKLVAQAKADSPARAEAEIRLGNAMWSKYLRRTQELRQQKAAAGDGASAAGADDPNVKQELDQLVKHAQESLERGLEGLKKSNQASNSAVLAAVALAKLYVSQSEDTKAAALLDDPKIGPMKLLQKKHPATQTEGISAEIYKTALRAYIGAEPQQLDKAMAALDGLEKIIAADATSGTQLTQMVVSIAYDLQQQLEQLNKQGDQEKTARVAKAFDKFLGRITDRAATADFKTLNWVARTYDGLADNVNTAKATPGEKASAESVPYYQKAITAYEGILTKAQADPTFLPADKLLGVRQLLAVDYRNVGDYAKSISNFADVLAQKPQFLTTQIEAARTYQLRGANENADWYASAIDGGTGPSKSIWGWGKIANVTFREAKYRDIFHDARYNIALCHQKYGDSRPTADEQAKQWQMAKDAIRTTKQFEPTWNDGKWKPQNEKLVRELQKQLNQPVVGLLEFESKATEPTGDQKK